MKNKEFKIRFASVALATMISSGTGIVLSRPTYALDDTSNDVKIEEEVFRTDDNVDSKEHVSDVANTITNSVEKVSNEKSAAWRCSCFSKISLF